MRVLEWLRGGDAVTASYGGGVTTIHPSTHRSLLALAGYSPSQLPASVTRLDAMKVPALAAGVSILTGIAAQLPLVAEPSSDADAFLQELDPNVPRGWTIARTVDDLIFHAIAYWYVTSRNAGGFPRTIQRVAPERVQVDLAADEVRIDGILVSNDDVIRFDGITDGILTTGAETITTALANVRQTRVYATNPKPSMILTDDDGQEPLEPDEARNYIAAFSESMRDHGMGYLAGFKLNDYGWNANDLQLIPARQHDAIECARLLTIPAHYLGASPGGSSLTYTTLPEIRRDLLEVGGLAQYATPIEQRLSMPDVTRRGTTVRFDAESFFLRVTPDADAPPTKPTPSEVPA